MAKRTANTELNHDNWNEEEEAEEPGTFAQADNDTMKGRVIKKAKRRGIAKADGAPSIFAGFGGFKAPAAADSEAKPPSAGGAFDFLAKKSSPPPPPKNGSSADKTDTPPALFNFASPAASKSAAVSTTGFAFGSGAAAKSDSSTFSFGSSAATTVFGGKSTESANSGSFSNSPVFKPASAPAPAGGPKWTCKDCWVGNDADKDNCVCCAAPKPGAAPAPAPVQVAKKSEESLPPAGSVTGSFDQFFAAQKQAKWTCNDCMVGNDADKDTCACCSAPKPGGATPKPAPTAAPATTVVTPNKKSDDYLAHLKALNVQLCTWIKTHIDKNPYVLLSPVFKDYEKHLTEIETKSAATGESGEKTNGSFGSGSSSKPLLGAVFGNNSNPEPVKFGSGGSGFSFGSSTTTKSGGTETKSTSGFTFGGSSDVKPVSESGTGTGFKFGSGENKSDKPAAAETSGFTFGSAATKTTTETKSSTGFTFGGSSDVKTVSDSGSGFKFGSGNEKTEKPAETSGFTFGTKSATETTKSSGFTFGSSSSEKPVAAASGFVFGSGSTTFGSW